MPPLSEQRYQERFPGQWADAYQQAMQAEPACGVRLNPLRAQIEEIYERLLEDGFELTPIPGLVAAYALPARQAEELGRHETVLRGQACPHKPDSMLIGDVLKPHPMERFFDLHAGYGEHGLAAAIHMGHEGRLTLNEQRRLRYQRLKENLKRWGIRIARAQQRPPSDLPSMAPDRYHRMMLETSGSGDLLFHTDDPSRWQTYTEERIRENGLRLRSELVAAMAGVAPGGVCVYATHSTAPEENEAVVNYVLRHGNGKILVEPVELPEGFKAETLPGLTQWRGDSYDEKLAETINLPPQGIYRGCFIAKLRKVSPVSSED